jgi:hypothetical protein
MLGTEARIWSLQVLPFQKQMRGEEKVGSDTDTEIETELGRIGIRTPKASRLPYQSRYHLAHPWKTIR